MTSLLLLHTSRELLTGRGVSAPVVARMRRVVTGVPGVVWVPDLFAVVVGPQRLLVAGDVVLEDVLDVPAVEGSLVAASVALRRSWPAVVSVYLNPVEAHRSRDADRPEDPTRSGGRGVDASARSAGG